MNKYMITTISYNDSKIFRSKIYLYFSSFSIQHNLMLWYSLIHICDSNDWSWICVSCEFYSAFLYFRVIVVMVFIRCRYQVNRKCWYMIRVIKESIWKMRAFVEWRCWIRRMAGITTIDEITRSMQQWLW